MEVLVIAAHADDEVLGCGGTIARHAALGDKVHVVFMADGVGARGIDEGTALIRRNKARDNALDILGVSNCYSLDLPDNRMDGVSLLDIVQALESIIQRVQPATIYTHHYGDLNVDHRITHQAVITACRPQPGSSVKEILTFEVMSSTEWNSPGGDPFLPNLFVDISDFLAIKLQALEAYELEMRPSPHSRSIEHLEYLARHRGNSMGMNAAEAFMVMRSLR
jgi:LmbE family N-acetylglucosaminyl deacetylase